MRYLIFLILNMLFLMSCDPDKQKMEATKHPSHQAVPTEEIPDAPIIDDQRVLWQNPELVIAKMGNLSGKVIADIGAGPSGFFAFPLSLRDVKKVIAMDIDEDAIQRMEDIKERLLDKAHQHKFEGRKVLEDDPLLKPGEADVVLMSNVCAYFNDRVSYFKNLKKGVSKGGLIIIVDYKKRKTMSGPSYNQRIAIGQMEKDLEAAGYSEYVSDDRTYDMHYIIVARNL